MRDWPLIQAKLFLCLIFSFSTLFAGEVIEQVVIEEGQIVNVKQIINDHEGFLWIRTDTNLIRYDGEAQYYKYKSNHASTLNNKPNHIFLGKEHLWVGTYKGLNRYNSRSNGFKRFNVSEYDEDLTEGIVTQIAEDSKNRLWIANGILTAFSPIRGQEFATTKLTEDGEIIENITTVMVDENDIVWASGFHNRIYRIDTENQTTSEVKLFRDEHVPVVLLYQEKGSIWLTINEYLYVLDTNTAKLRLPDLPDIPNQPWETLDAIALHRDRNGRIWIGTKNDGIYRYNAQSNLWDNLSYDPERPKLHLGSINSFSEDKNGNMWVGVSTGLNRIREDDSHFTHIRPFSDAPGSLVGKEVHSILVDHESSLWVATERGLNYLNMDTEGFELVKKIDPGSQIVSLAAADNDTIWFIYKGTAYQMGLDLRVRQKIALAIESEEHQEFWRIVPGENDTAWVASSHGLLYCKPGAKTSKSVLQGEKNKRVSDIFKSESGHLWINYGSNLAFIDLKTKKITPVYKPKEDDKKLVVFDFEEDLHGRIWMVTETELACYDPKKEKLKFYNKEQGLIVDTPMSVRRDNRGYLWITHAGGLTRYNPDHRESVMFDIRDGINNFFNYASAFRASDGELFFGGSHGFNRFMPENIRNTTHAPPLQILMIYKDKIKHHSDLINKHNELYIAYESIETLEFKVGVMDFTNPRKNLYSWRVDDNDWKIPTTKSWFSPNINSPGTYTLHIRGSNGNGQWRELDNPITIIVDAPIWMTREAIIFYILFFPTLLYLGYRYRIRHYRQRSMELERLVSERTESLRLEKEKTEEQARKLLEMDKLKTQFFSNISHEFRTPLTLILGPLELLLSGEKEGSESKYKVMLRNARRLLRLINQLLDISKLEAGKMRLLTRPVPVYSFLKPIVGAFDSLAETNKITLELTSQDHVDPDTHLEPEKIEKVMFNLLGNAFQFTSKGGSIKVHVSQSMDQGHKVALISVRDTGEGIPAQSLPHIFDRFRQADGSVTRKKEGTGIGLSLVKELVELHRGRVWVESIHGEGTCFYFTLPLGTNHLRPEEIQDTRFDADQFVASQAAVEMSNLDIERDTSFKAKQNMKSETVLVVDDHPDIRDYISSALSQQYFILEAADGEEGLDKLYNYNPDLIISDVMMPNMDGYEMVRRIRKDKNVNHVPIIMLTAKASDEMKVEGLEIGANDYLSKPFNVRELAARVRNLLNIREQERMMKRSLEMAHRAQVSMLPGSLPEVADLDLAAYAQPAREVGGDYYDFIQCPDEKLGVIIGDVSGKGMSAALYMTMTKGLVQAYGIDCHSPASSLKQINQQFYRASAANIFISLQYALIDHKKGELVYANAGHNPIIHYQKSTGKTLYLENKGMAIGLEKGTMFDKIIHDERVSTTPGDVFLFYTDGLTEGMNEHQEIYGEKRLIDVVEANGDLGATELLAKIQDNYNEFVGNMDPFDDLTIVIVKIPVKT